MNSIIPILSKLRSKSSYKFGCFLFCTALNFSLRYIHLPTCHQYCDNPQTPQIQHMCNWPHHFSSFPLSPSGFSLVFWFNWKPLLFIQSSRRDIFPSLCRPTSNQLASLTDSLPFYNLVNLPPSLPSQFKLSAAAASWPPSVYWVWSHPVHSFYNRLSVLSNMKV